MSIKLVLLKSGEQVITDVKELVSEEKVRGYLFNKPQKVVTEKSVFLTEEEGSNDVNVQITLSPLILLTEDDEMVIPIDWVVTAVDPIKSLIEMYQEKINGKVN